jgi:hypothetical protein
MIRGQSRKEDNVMAKIKIDLRNIQEKPGLMIGLGALGVLFVLVVFLVFSSLFAPKAVAEAPTPTATKELTETPTATLAPTRLPPTATLMPTPVPVSSLLWAPDHIGTYIHRVPGGEILGLVPNGTGLVLLEETKKMGGLSWQAIEQDEQVGWVLAEFVHQVEGAPSHHIAGEGGAFLRRSPHGKVIAWLSEGVPVMAVIEHREDASLVWSRVVMPGGEIGWVADFLLSPTEGGE